jgi:hypothetical protein
VRGDWQRETMFGRRHPGTLRGGGRRHAHDDVQTNARHLAVADRALGAE